MQLWNRLELSRAGEVCHCPVPWGQGQRVCDGLEELSSGSALFSVKGTHPAIVRLTEMHYVKFRGEFFSYRGCLIELKEIFA